MCKLQIIYRLGYHNSRWIVALPEGKGVGLIEHDLPLIKEQLKKKYLGGDPNTKFTYIECLGRG